MPPKSCPCACKPVKRKRRTTRPRAQRVRQMLPAPGILMTQAPILQAPVKAQVEKITMGTQTEAPKRVSIGVEAKPQSVSVGTETQPKQTSEMGIQADARKAVREMGTQMINVPPSRPIDERMNIPYTARTGRDFRSSLSSVKEGGKPGRPTKAQAEEKLLAKIEKMEAEVPKPVEPPKPKGLQQPSITKFFGKK